MLLAKLIIGTCVIIINGPFTGYRGLVHEIAQDKRYIVRICDNELCLQFPTEKKNLKQIPEGECK